MARITTLLVALPLVLASAVAHARVVRVPEDAATLQTAVGKASPGDTIQVGAGRWCGARIDKRLNLIGAKGAVIVGRVGEVTCSGPFHTVGLIGLYLTSPEASGTTIRHFTFDGSHADEDASSLALAIYARDDQGGTIDDVRVEHNTILGTVQGITNWGGDGWVVRHNTLLGLTAFRSGPYTGAGGTGIAVVDSGTGERPGGASIAHNHVEGDVSSPVFRGVFVASADNPEVRGNRFRLQARDGGGIGVGVDVDRGGAGGSSGVHIRSNDGASSDYVAVVGGTNGENRTGLILDNNVGTVLVEGELYESSLPARGGGAGKKGETGRPELHGRSKKVL